MESVIRQTEGVDGAVLSIQNTQLVAYVVPREASATTVQNRCRETLPAYMVPSVVVSLACWPLNAYGKISRQLLPVPHQNQTEQLTVWSNTNETKIAQVCTAILALSPTVLTADTNLLAVGMTSLLAAACAAQFEKNGLLGLTAVKVLQSPNIVSLGKQLLSADQSSVAKIARLPLQPSGQGICLSAQQHQMWMLHEANSTSVSYTSPGRICFVSN